MCIKVRLLGSISLRRRIRKLWRGIRGTIKPGRKYIRNKSRIIANWEKLHQSNLPPPSLSSSILKFRSARNQSRINRWIWKLVIWRKRKLLTRGPWSCKLMSKLVMWERRIWITGNNFWMRKISFRAGLKAILKAAGWKISIIAKCQWCDLLILLTKRKEEERAEGGVRKKRK